MRLTTQRKVSQETSAVSRKGMPIRLSWYAPKSCTGTHMARNMTQIALKAMLTIETIRKYTAQDRSNVRFDTDRCSVWVSSVRGGA